MNLQELIKEYEELDKAEQMVEAGDVLEQLKELEKELSD
jgi:hypothetical protein